MDKQILQIFEDSLERCNTNPVFMDRFYETFLASDPQVREKFKDTDFTKQKEALRESLQKMVLVAENEDSGPHKYLQDLAVSHSRGNLDIGAAFYDLWIDSLLATVKEIDPQFNTEIEAAWEKVMMIGISYMLSRYNRPLDTD